MNRNEIAAKVVNSNAIVGSDMLTNREKIGLVCQVFQCDGVALEERFEFDAVIGTGDPMMVYASIHLASLQFEYFTRLHLEKLVDDEQYDWWLSYLELSKSKLRWAFSYLRFGINPPPYPFIN